MKMYDDRRHIARIFSVIELRLGSSDGNIGDMDGYDKGRQGGKFFEKPGRKPNE